MNRAGFSTWARLITYISIALLLLHRPALRCTAEIVDLSFKEDPRSLIEIWSFGFSARGAVDIKASDLLYDGNNTANASLVGFFLVAENDQVTAKSDLVTDHEQCILQEEQPIEVLITFKDLDASNRLDHNSIAPRADYFTLFFANCNPGSRVSMQLRATFYNLEGTDGHRDYLSIGQTPLPAIYFMFSLVTASLLITWVYMCLKKRRTTHRIHVLMGVLVFLKALYLFSEGERQAYIKRTGSLHGWEAVVYIFGFLKGVMLFTVIVLIGAGWSILRPHLRGNERWVLMIVIPLQIVGNAAELFIGREPFSLQWDRIMFLIDVICCCAVLLPILWSIKHLRHIAQTNGKAAANLVKLTLFQQYYMVVVFYIYLTRVAVVVLEGALPYSSAWVSMLASEMVTFAFYAFTGYKFRPAPYNPYFMLEEDEELASEDFKDGDFEF